jgi:uncharacterized protein YeaO (DUF488 family)
MGSETSATAASTIQLKRAYESPETSDGVRVLVDRLWARGVSKESAQLDAWMKGLGPTAELRRWFGHQSERWDAFVEKFRIELRTPLRQLLLAELQGIAAGSTLTLVYGARDTKENEAVILRQHLLHDREHPDGAWDAPTKLLVTAAVVAAARHDAVARASGVKLFASPILAAAEFDRAFKEVVASGTLRQASGGWQLTSSGEREVRQLANTDSATGTSS